MFFQRTSYYLSDFLYSLLNLVEFIFYAVSSIYGTNNQKAKDYKIEVESIRGQIQRVLKDDNNNEPYSNDEWNISFIDEKDAESFSIKDFKQAIKDANLNQEQTKILEDIITKGDLQAHVRITPKV